MSDEATLTLDGEELDRANTLLAAFLSDHAASVRERPLLPELDRPGLQALLDRGFPAHGVGVEGLFAELRETVLPNSTAVDHPRFLAYVLGGPHGIGPHAEAIAAALNQNCNFWQLSPAASVIERSVITWLAGLFDLGPDAGGILTGGGSLATLDALATALADRRPHFRASGLQSGGPPLVVYTSEQAHRCVDKAAAILGLGLDHVRHIPTDGRQRLRTDLLADAVRGDRAAGLEPFCVVASAGTVTTGAIDPIGEIAEVCEREGLWLHVDGAYGALFVLAERARGLFADLRRADSIALDPHKLLFAPLEVGALVVRDPVKLRTAFAMSSSYLTVAEDPLMTDFMDHGPQLSRGFKAFKVWAGLMTFGTDAFAAVANRTLELAAHLADRIRVAPAVELLAPADLTAVCFAVPELDAAGHRDLLARLAAEGTALLGPAVVDGRPGIRACITNHRTTEADLDTVIDRLTFLAIDIAADIAVGAEPDEAIAPST